MEWLFIAPIAGIISVLVAVYLYYYVSKQDAGSPQMIEISDAIKIGANAYLKRQNKTLAIFVAVLAIVLAVGFNVYMALAYVLGSLCTTIAAYFGMNAAVRANVRTANAAKKGLNPAFSTAFFGGAVMGLSIVGMALLGSSILYYVFNIVYQDPIAALDTVLGFSFGASALALFAKAGGGIFTKTADIGADLVGKVEVGLPEDDPRNPAVIADNVGDNVGDVAGMGADLTDSYIAGMIAAMIIGAETYVGQVTYILLPILIKASGILASVLGLLILRVGQKSNPGAALNRGTFGTCFIFAVLTFIMINFLQLGNRGLGIFFSAIAGLVAGMIIGITTDFFTSIDRTPVLKTAESSKTGAAINILNGFSYGTLSIIPPILGIVVAMFATWNIALAFDVNPFYGIAIAAVGMLATLGMVIAADAYGPIVDNAKGIAEQSGLGEEVIEIADKLDAAGNTSKAITKGFAIGAAALQVIALFNAYTVVVGIDITTVAGLAALSLMDITVLSGMFIGAMLPPVFAALLILAVGKNGDRMVEEIRRQFREDPGIMKGESKPDYASCVDIAAKGALTELILPGVLAVIAPLAVGFFLGSAALAGFLAGSIITGIIFALFMSNSGGMWDNAKKYIETGKLGGKGSDAHKAAVIGDTVGDPFKDTAGPSLNTMITVMTLVATVFAPLILLYAL
jgi:K(+)-stimulated pyrophosphate-energized sodium pump